MENTIRSNYLCKLVSNKNIWIISKYLAASCLAAKKDLSSNLQLIFPHRMLHKFFPSRIRTNLAYRFDCIVQCREDHDSRGVRSKTPTSAQPCLCQNRSANWSCHRSTERERHRSTTSSAHRSTCTSHIPSADAKDRRRPSQCTQATTQTFS